MKGRGPDVPLIFTTFSEKCNFCTYFSHWATTGRLVKSAISAPNLLVGHQMYHTTVRLMKSAISAPNLLVGHQMYHSTVRLAKSAISAPTFLIGPPNVP